MRLFAYDIEGSDRDLKQGRMYLYDYVISELFGANVPSTDTGKNGKPIFLPPYDDYHFNISHSGSMVVMGIGKSPLGVDIEHIGRVKNYKRLAERFFYEAERHRIQAADDPEREFYRIWTFREAFSKLVGVGITLYEREEIDIDYEKDSVSYDGRRYVFYEYKHSGYCFTLCVEPDEMRPDIEYIKG